MFFAIVATSIGDSRGEFRRWLKLVRLIYLRLSGVLLEAGLGRFEIWPVKSVIDAACGIHGVGDEFFIFQFDEAIRRDEVSR